MSDFEHPHGISTYKLMEKLKLSRNYITRNITHCVRHLEDYPSKGAAVRFDEQELRRYLASKASFTRQTKRINVIYEMQKYEAEHPGTIVEDQTAFIGKVPRDIRDLPRSALPAIPIQAKDFWDFELYFPKEYTQGNDSPDAPVKSTEICYRDMYRGGAVKIQLGTQKTMFYLPKDEHVEIPKLSDISSANPKDMQYYLVPADWEPYYEGHKQPNAVAAAPKKFELSVTALESDFDMQRLESSIRKGFVIDNVAQYQLDAQGTTKIIFTVHTSS